MKIDSRSSWPCRARLTILLAAFFITSGSSVVHAQNPVLDSLLSVLPSQKMDSTKVNVLYNISWEYRSIDKKLAFSFIEEGLSLSQEINFEIGYMTGLKDLGVLQIMYGFTSQADSTLDIALSFAREIKSGYYISKTLSNIAWHHETQGNFDLSEKYFIEALNTPNAKLSALDSASCYNGMGVANFKKGAYDKAIAHYLKGLVIYDSLEMTSAISICMNNIGGVFYRQGAIDKALDYFEKSLAIKREIGDIFGIASSLNNIAGVYFENNDTARAIDYFKQSLKIREKVGDVQGTAGIMNNLGTVYRQMHQHEKAINYYKRSLELKERLGDKGGITVTLNNIAIAYREIESFEQALVYSSRSLKMAIEIGAYDDIKIGYETMAQIYGLMHNYEKAYENHTAFVKIKDSLFNIEKAQQIEELERIYNTDKQEKELKLEKALNAQMDAEIKEKDLRTNAIIVIFFLLALVAVLLFVFYLIKRQEAEKKSLHERNILLKEMELLRATLNIELEQPVERQKMSIDRDNMNGNLVTPLSERELEVLDLICDGKTNKVIGEELFVSINTIKSHVLRIYEKLDVNNRTQALKRVGHFNQVS
ncbi:MAG TPA: tetratricopeptide repeat protein [Flavobacteriales bacterium]|nr:tetratricopeptide repeat protein [Flavobacteriales bacterium]